ncbi:hypothetical protein [Sulfurospirillum multivorans]|uniref:Adenine-specific DNA methylase n=2 Tax=Sulfurospirillum multivorans TaxID=66821 RepID=A0AA86E2V4_SULMK|nr:hypothetical protein [Sulfurospirillum multivorans]AHJ13137.1 hypothetical protein SMUL_1882 [Sulfurospirillum multivorans DSM 12446]QEH06625.1 hypothetical protein SMN_1860 [Sulfurospirillum multivorans]
MTINRAFAMPSSNTFEIKPIRELIEKYVATVSDVLWIDPFANRNKFAHVTNDLNPDFNTNYSMDALAFLRLFENHSVGGVLFDPPYSSRQVSECYKSFGLPINKETTQSRYWADLKKEIARILRGGEFVSVVLGIAAVLEKCWDLKPKRF